MSRLCQTASPPIRQTFSACRRQNARMNGNRTRVLAASSSKGGSFPRNEPNRPSRKSLLERERNTRGEGRRICQSYLAICQSYLAICQSYLATPRSSRRTNSWLSAPDASSLTGSPRRRDREQLEVDPSRFRSPRRSTQPTTRPRPHRCAIYRSAVASDDDDWTGLAACPRKNCRPDRSRRPRDHDGHAATLVDPSSLSFPVERHFGRGATHRNLGLEYARTERHERQTGRDSRPVTECCDKDGVLNDRTSGCLRWSVSRRCC